MYLRDLKVYDEHILKSSPFDQIINPKVILRYRGFSFDVEKYSRRKGITGWMDATQFVRTNKNGTQ